MGECFHYRSDDEPFYRGARRDRRGRRGETSEVLQISEVWIVIIPTTPLITTWLYFQASFSYVRDTPYGFFPEPALLMI